MEDKREGQFKNGDIWTGESYEEEPGKILYLAIDENGEEYGTEEVPERDVIDFGLIQFEGHWTEDQVIKYFANSQMTDWALEAVATDKEKAYAQETEQMMHDAGYGGTYAGGSRSKGNGFWLTKNGQSLGYKNCRSIRSIVNS